MNKYITFTIAIMLFSICSLAQSNKFNYQGIARNSSGQPLEGKDITIRISIIDETIAGANLYTEVHNVTTNDYGLYNVVIGEGDVVSGNIGAIDWGSDKKFIKVQLDPNGGSDFSNLGTKELLSVPYAMYAFDGASGLQGNTNRLVKFTGAHTGGNSSVFDDGTRVGIKTTSPTAGQLHIHNNTNVEGRIHLTNTATGGGVNDGFLIGGAGSAGSGNHLVIWNYEDAPIRFGTNGSERMRISGNGNVVLGASTPDYRFKVDGVTGTFNDNGVRIVNTTAGSGWSLYSSSSGALIIGRNSNLGQFDGTSGVYTSLSDARLKKNITVLDPVLPKLMGLSAKRYQFINDKDNDYYIGFIAQDIRQYFPEFVSVHEANDGNPFLNDQLGLDYAGMSVLAIKAIQEQQVMIEALKQEIEKLKSQMK